MQRPDLTQSQDDLTKFLNGLIEKFLAIAGDYVVDGIEPLARMVVPKSLEMVADAMHRYPTLSHGDFRTANLLFDDLPDGTSKPVVFDWQNVTDWGFGRDISHFLNSSFSVESRRRYEMTLVSEFHNVLVDGGVNDLSKPPSAKPPARNIMRITRAA